MFDGVIKKTTKTIFFVKTTKRS